MTIARRLATCARRIVGAVALGAAAWWSIEAAMTWWAMRYLGHAPLEGADAETGDRYGVRVTPLSAAETAAAIALEQAVARELQADPE